MLGPIPPNQPNQLAINKAKPFLNEFLPAYIFTHLGVTSLYHLANWIGLPGLSLLNMLQQDHLYQHILTMYPQKKIEGELTQNEKIDWVNRGYYLPTLKEQQFYAMQLNKNKMDQFEEKLKSLEPGLNHWMSKLGWGEKNKLAQLRNELIGHTIEALFELEIDASLSDVFMPRWLRIIHVVFDLIFYRLVTLMNLFLDVVPEPVPAMGAMGSTSSLVTNVDQSDYLWSHSAMKVPTEAILKKSYGLMV